MIKISEVTNEYCLKEIAGGELELIPTRDLLEEWYTIEPEDKTNYFIAVPTQVDLDAAEILNEYFRDIAEYLGLEDAMLENMQNTPTKEQIKTIQDIFNDMLEKTSSFDYYEKGQRINPNY